MSKITKNTTISEALEMFPRAAEIMQSHGLHCVGCHVNVMESIEGGAKGHGMDDEAVNQIINDINEAMESSKTSGSQQLITPLIVTSKAAAKIKSLLQAENKPDYALKVSVLSGGCSGHKYDLSFVKSAKEGDYAIEKDGAKIFVDKDSLEFLSGSELDFVESLSESGFKFKNPNAKTTCGCGDSFS